jgi:7-keto-8-aminopelargonate synthetase-like enzyme
VNRFCLFPGSQDYINFDKIKFSDMIKMELPKEAESEIGKFNISAKQLLDEGIYVIGFFYPVVAKGQARIRVQISAAHTSEHLQTAINAFIKVGNKLSVIV